MERKFLEDLGIVKETIDKIMAENGKDIETHKSAVTAKETELTTANDALKALQETVKKYDGKDPEKLESDLKALRQKYDADLSAAKLSSAVDLALTGAKAKNLTAAKALLKMDAITLDGDKVIGLDDQIKAITKETPFLFGGEQHNPPPPDTFGRKITSYDGMPDTLWLLHQSMLICVDFNRCGYSRRKNS